MSKPPQKRPCGSCPYRQDVPSGVWHESEYLKLPLYDRPTIEQPVAVFMCHQQDGHLCAGWCGTHDMENNMAIRISMSMGHISPEDFDAILEYESPVPLFESGMDAAAHGLKEIFNPGTRAQTTMKNLKRKGLGNGTPGNPGPGDQTGS